MEKKQNAKSLYSGRIQALVEDLGVEDIVCMRLKGKAGFYPTVTCKEAFFSGLHAKHRGLTILSVHEITLDALRTPDFAGIYAAYCREGLDPDGGRLAAAVARYGKRLLLHRMSDGQPRLIVAGSVELHRRPPRGFRYWENGYTYRDVYIHHTVPGID